MRTDAYYCYPNSTHAGSKNSILDLMALEVGGIRLSHIPCFDDRGLLDSGEAGDAESEKGSCDSRNGFERLSGFISSRIEFVNYMSAFQ